MVLVGVALRTIKHSEDRVGRYVSYMLGKFHNMMMEYRVSATLDTRVCGCITGRGTTVEDKAGSVNGGQQIKVYARRLSKRAWTFALISLGVGCYE